MRPLDPRLLRRARAVRHHVALTAVLGLVSALLVVAQAVLVALLLVPLIQDQSIDAERAIQLLTALAAVAAARAVAAWAQERYAQRAATRTIAELREQVVNHAAALGPRWEPRKAEVATLVTRGLDDLAPYLVKYLPALMLTALATPVLLLVLLRLDWVSFLICVVTLPLVPLFMWLVGVMTAGTSERRLAVVSALGAQVLDLLAGLPTLRAFGREIGPGARVRALGEASKRATMGTLRIAFLSGMVLELLTTLSVAIVAVGVGLRLVYGEIDLLPALIVLMLAPEVYLPLRQVGAQFHASTDGLAAAEKAFAILETPADSQDISDAGRRAAPAAVHAVRFEHVTVRAGDRGLEAPADLSTRIPLDGRVIAWRGPSGAGKSTAALVLLGLMRPDSGRVLLEAEGESLDLSHTDLEAWWRQIVWVPQRPALPPGPLRAVVTEGNPATEDELVAAARATGLDDVVAALPQGWDTEIGLGGVGLSAGQRQRVALTAALLTGADRRLVILDEPTAHLDADGEQVILDAVRSWRAAGRTVLLIAHRASLLSLADDVVEIGSQETTTDTPPVAEGLPAAQPLEVAR
ncbi:thiol reductant ABC exporter subunit CydD [Bogoriella caseilytica]|uniref:ATP-binding cassette subfamily C protein CydD n=1 Tax=Bogoriella caseilytica TaxID=56055 RepID=A0A3N2BD88_9MICO|nr:thiol reductant ABC exporter subunit CydD [Bogoriella caseilytica]ROR73014.1 ATP-binding cassette subfamily C protein CydD [Bogoriella caseilytica]